MTLIERSGDFFLFGLFISLTLIGVVDPLSAFKTLNAGQIDKREDKLADKLGEKEEVMAFRVADLVTNALRKKKPSIRG
jgi:hypothetical protein